MQALCEYHTDMGVTLSSTSYDTSSEGLRCAVAGFASAVGALMSPFRIRMGNGVCHSPEGAKSLVFDSGLYINVRARN